ncbi:MAG: hypothetical protein ACLFM8_06345, partial [Halobacteriales archaeon]
PSGNPFGETRSSRSIPATVPTIAVATTGQEQTGQRRKPRRSNSRGSVTLATSLDTIIRTTATFGERMAARIAVLEMSKPTVPLTSPPRRSIPRPRVPAPR